MTHRGLCSVALWAVCAAAQAAHPYGDDQIEVTVGEPFTIGSSPGHYNFPTLHQISQKKLFVNIWASPDATLEEEEVNEVGVWTEDGGLTWGEPVRFHGQQAGGHSWLRRRDGSCVWLSYFVRPLRDTTVSCNVGHSRDGKTYTWSVGEVQLPEPVKWDTGRSLSPMQFARTIMEMDDGSLLATMYGFFEGDFPKFRSLLVRSVDGGKHWAYYSTIASSPDAPSWGYQEPVMIRTAAGDLLCVMRVGSQLPMWTSRSKDDGLTWSRPRELSDYAASVFPDAVLMSNGILAVSFGRPGCHIMFSVDGKGRRWTSRTTIPLTGGSDCYTAIREVAPGRLLYVHHETLPEGNAIRGVFVDVKRK